MELPSTHLQNASDQIATLPGIGKKSALRIALNLLSRNKEEVEAFLKAIQGMKENVRFCSTCHNISDDLECSICSNPKRDNETLCVVEDVRDVMAIEATGTFKGKYHVLGGVISPMDGVSPKDLNIETLIQRVEQGSIHELIFALSPTMEGDTTNYYIFKKLKDHSLVVTTLSRGIAIGSELHYADELTLGRSFQNRQPYHGAK
ncbi:MAG: hypothetical protein RL264_2525 [Bacteroidota bacterium]|jgi:recombination protein RecR